MLEIVGVTTHKFQFPLKSIHVGTPAMYRYISHLLKHQHMKTTGVWIPTSQAIHMSFKVMNSDG